MGGGGHFHLCLCEQVTFIAINYSHVGRRPIPHIIAFEAEPKGL
jgi:hypothetical protein